MFNSSKQFGLVFLALAMSALIVTLAACGDSGTGPRETSSSSGGSTGEPSSTTTKPDENVDVSISVSVDGTKHETLTINATVTAKDQALTFDKVEIKFDGKTLNKPDDAKDQWTYGVTNLEYDFNGEEYCDGKTWEVVINVYREGQSAPKATEKATFKRNTNLCKTPSSSSMSSSSAVVLRFEKMKFGGNDTLVLTTGAGTKGIILASSEGTENASLADIYYEHTQDPGAIKAGKSNVKMIIEFKRPSGNFGSLIPANANNAAGSEPHILGEPQNTSTFEFRPTNAGSSEIQPKWQFFMVRTGSTESTWQTSDYLLASPAGATTSGTNKIVKIVAWKVVAQ